MFEVENGQDVAVPSSSVKLQEQSSVVCYGELRTSRTVVLDGNWLMALEREILNEQTSRVQAVSLIIPILLWPFHGGIRLVHAQPSFSVWKIHLKTY